MILGFWFGEMVTPPKRMLTFVCATEQQQSAVQYQEHLITRWCGSLHHLWQLLRSSFWQLSLLPTQSGAEWELQFTGFLLGIVCSCGSSVKFGQYWCRLASKDNPANAKFLTNLSYCLTWSMIKALLCVTGYSSTNHIAQTFKIGLFQSRECDIFDRKWPTPTTRNNHGIRDKDPDDGDTCSGGLDRYLQEKYGNTWRSKSKVLISHACFP